MVAGKQREEAKSDKEAQDDVPTINAPEIPAMPDLETASQEEATEYLVQRTAKAVYDALVVPMNQRLEVLETNFKGKVTEDDKEKYQNAVTQVQSFVKLRPDTMELRGEIAEAQRARPGAPMHELYNFARRQKGLPALPDDEASKWLDSEFKGPEEDGEAPPEPAPNPAGEEIVTASPPIPTPPNQTKPGGEDGRHDKLGLGDGSGVDAAYDEVVKGLAIT